MLDAAALAAEYAEDLILGTVRDVHGAVSTRVHRVTDRVAAGTTLGHRVHDGISKVVYTGISASLKVSAKGLRAAGEAGIGSEPRGHVPRPVRRARPSTG